MLFMEFHQLEALVAVARLQSFGRAAEHLHLTQPAISIAIRKLEVEVGAALFDRYRKEIRLTEAGRVLLEYAQSILNLKGQAGDALSELRALHRGKVRIGANETTNLYVLPQLILAFRSRYPDVKVEVFRSSSVQIPQELKERNLDFGFIAYDPIDPDLLFVPILEDPLILVVRPDHRFAKRRKIRLQDLGAETFVAHNVRTPSRDYVIDIFRKNSVPLNIGIELSSIETIKQFVELKLGIAFLPGLSVEKELAERKLVPVKVESFNHTRLLRAIYLKDKVHSHAAEKFLEVVKSNCR